MPHTVDNNISSILLNECLAGKRSAQTALYDLLAPRMLGVCQRYAKSACEARDILQEGFVRVFTYLHHFRQEGSFEGWVRKIMVNCALQQIRKKGRLHTIELETMVEVCPAVAANGNQNLQKADLLKAIRKLPQTYQLVFNLYVFEELTHKEIAAALNIAEGTSKSNLHDARRILQESLIDYRDTYLVKKTG